MKKMTTKELVMSTINSLAGSQGFYSRLQRDLGVNGEFAPDGFFDQFAGCASDLDVVLALEC